jgi:methyltransferase (TIGR00027 family)
MNVRTERRIETKVSRTAEMCCLSRAFSFYERNPYLRSEDFVATALVPRIVALLARLALSRRLLLSLFFPKGMYEYVIARTKYIDDVFINAVSKGFDQILIFGAGFDSRGIRLIGDEKRVTTFELDAQQTQNAKKGRLRQLGFPESSNIVYVPIDFERESTHKKVMSYGFDPNKRTLFILEGVLMYLNQDAVNDTFRFINQCAGPGSEIVFDYVLASVFRGDVNRYGAKKAYETIVKWDKGGEQWTFAIEETEIERFLQERGLRLVRQLSTADLEKIYFTDQQGKRVARINGTQYIVLAKKQRTALVKARAGSKHMS